MSALTNMINDIILTDTSNELCYTGSVTRRCSAKERSRLIDDAIEAGFVAYRGRQSRFATYTKGAVPDDVEAFALVFDLERGTVTVEKVALTALGMAA